MTLIRRVAGRRVGSGKGVAYSPTWPEKCPEILRRRAGGETLKAIGKDLGISKERVRQIEFLCKARHMVSVEFVLAHIEKTNPHPAGTPRDAWGGNDVNDLRRRQWYGPFDIDPSEFCAKNLWAANKRDVKRYAKRWKEGSVPPAVVAYPRVDGKLIAVDGAHRVEAAALLGLRIPTYIGVLPGAGRHNKLSRAAAFQQLAMAQRGEPEMAMDRLQHAQIAQEYGWLCEHVGDLTNRMAQHWENGCWDWGVGVTGEKVKKTLRVLRRGATLQRSILPQIKSDIRFQQEQGSVKGYPTTETAALRKLRALGKDYAQAHEALTVWNELQGHARDAAVALGRFDFDGAVTHLEALESVLNQDDEVWCIEAGKYTGEPV